ncbi:UmoA family flagellar biogenesis regulator [Proteus myxofaciens]|uniref:UmoA family protein n=1 Tax=Proteus myxofaciens ATCC 19692 TaxID=1354337 RepID=A0A198FYB2_9GAMM|nr:UmoA family flagellar biogenesis regulator [Proteus myxofaciens]OAT29096.1 UmoA family protein [Proteus myxofaciens ATCC 19692]
MSAKSLVIFFFLLGISCLCQAGNGLVDRTWAASGMDTHSYRQALRQPTIGSRYTLFNITPDMPIPGGTSPLEPQGIRYIAMKYGPYGQPEHYKTYKIMFSHYSTTSTKKIRYLGELYTVVGDIYLIDPFATTNEWERGRSQIVEEYYEILDAHGNRTGKGLRFHNWDRPINVTKWSSD